jgi:hypothetical protein
VPQQPDNTPEEQAFIEKIRSISFGGIKKGTISGNEDLDFKHKLETDLKDLTADRSIDIKTADAQAGIAGLCEPQGSQEKERTSNI